MNTIYRVSQKLTPFLQCFVITSVIIRPPGTLVPEGLIYYP